MDLHKKQMQEAATLYYEKKYTQQEIAVMMNLSRQTVSKLLNDAISENVVEIKVNNPQIVCNEMEKELSERFDTKVIVCGVSTWDESVRQLMSVKKATEYVLSVLREGNLNIGISWGHTIQSFISEFPQIKLFKNTVFPLFGATDQDQACYMSNELARSFADKIGAKLKCAWFPYRPDSVEDCELFKKTSYYNKLNDLWNNIDVAIVGIGDYEILHNFGRIFGYTKKAASSIGDISTHFFNIKGDFLEVYENTLCASSENLKNAKKTIAIACGDNKTEAIIGALRTQVIDTLITDEHTARNILEFLKDGAYCNGVHYYDIVTKEKNNV